MQRNMKLGLALVACAVIVAAGALVGLRLLSPMPPPENPPQGYVNVLVISGSTQINLTLTQLVQMNPVGGNSRYQNQLGLWNDYGTYKGVRLSTIVETVGSVSAHDMIRVNATDGYWQMYFYDNLYPNATLYALQGDFILAYSYNGSTPPTWDIGPRIACLPPDGNYSNDDMTQTTPSAWRPASAGARWVYNVSTIELIHVHPIEGTVNVQVIDGTTIVNLTLPQLQEMNPIKGNSAFQNQVGNWRNYGLYEGVLLSTIIETVGTMGADDVVNVTATDGVWQLYSYDNLYPNATFQAIQGDLILAYGFNETGPPTWTSGPRIAFLPADEGYSNDDANQTTPSAWYPVGSSAGSRWVKWVATIRLVHGAYPPATSQHFAAHEEDSSPRTTDSSSPTGTLPTADLLGDGQLFLQDDCFPPLKPELSRYQWREHY